MFGKSDLLNGMFVETANGEYWMVMKKSIYGDILVNLSDINGYRRFLDLHFFSDDLIHADSDNTIVKVVKPEFFPDIFDPAEELSSSLVVYNREDIKELTVGQIEKILRYKIKIVKGEED